MKSRFSLFFLAAAFCATSAWAQIGIHAGYYGNQIKEAFVGADVTIPLGPVALMPNVDYTKSHGIGYWWFNGDVTLRMPSSGPTWWIGGGPTYAYYTGYNSGLLGTGSSTYKEWGWDATAGVAGNFAGFKPYLTGRYMQIKGDVISGAAIGLRF
jgi:hypothetical protein